MQLDNIPADTRLALKDLSVKDCSRSLFFDRFARPALKGEVRNEFFTDGCGAHPAPEKTVSWKGWLQSICKDNAPQRLFAKLQSRMMVNMAGGVMENAGLCLDRFGIPYIPGSAVKGCGRHMAIQNLMEARESNGTSEKLVLLLADIALVFGWGEQDWKTDKDKKGRLTSDFVHAVGENRWIDVSAQVRQLLPPSKDFGGSVSFLPAYPLALPSKDLELDILTCHHPKYYEEKIPVALDNEDLNPVVFPAVAAKIVFQFAVLPLRQERYSHAQPNCKLQVVALEWLRQGLESLGVGAKTAAGYGWFDASEKFNQTIVADEARELAHLRQKKEADAEKARLQKEEDERAIKRRLEKQALAILTPEQQEDYKIEKLTNDQFRAKLDNFQTIKTESERQAVVRALRVDLGSRGSRRTFWDDLKVKAQRKGGKSAQIEQLIRQISKQLDLGKMP